MLMLMRRQLLRMIRSEIVAMPFEDVRNRGCVGFSFFLFEIEDTRKASVFFLFNYATRR